MGLTTGLCGPPLERSNARLSGAEPHEEGNLKGGAELRATEVHAGPYLATSEATFQEEADRRAALGDELADLRTWHPERYFPGAVHRAEEGGVLATEAAERKIKGGTGPENRRDGRAPNENAPRREPRSMLLAQLPFGIRIGPREQPEPRILRLGNCPLEDGFNRRKREVSFKRFEGSMQLTQETLIGLLVVIKETKKLPLRLSKRRISYCGNSRSFFLDVAHRNRCIRRYFKDGRFCASCTVVVDDDEFVLGAIQPLLGEQARERSAERLGTAVGRDEDRKAHGGGTVKHLVKDCSPFPRPQPRV